MHVDFDVHRLIFIFFFFNIFYNSFKLGTLTSFYSSYLISLRKDIEFQIFDFKKGVNTLSLF